MCPYAGVRLPQQNDCLAIAIRARVYRRVASVLLRFALEFLFNPQFDLEPNYIIRKPLLRRIQRYILRREILSFFHTRVDNRSIRHFCIVFTPKLPLPLRQSPPKSNTPIPSPTPLTTPNGIRIQSAMLSLLTCADGHMGQAKAPSHKRFALWSDALKIGEPRPVRRNCEVYEARLCTADVDQHSGQINCVR